jgi:hypothetical protein
MPGQHDTIPEATLARLLGPAGHELGCEECFDHLDEYVELELSTADPEASIPGMRAHLEGCPACAEDHASLRDLVAGGGPVGTTAGPGF